MNPLQSELGLTYKGENFVVFFGGTHATLADLQIEYAQVDFLRIKQTHSNIVVEASIQTVEADAHYSENMAEALLIATADCMPIMIYCEQTPLSALDLSKTDYRTAELV